MLSLRLQLILTLTLIGILSSVSELQYNARTDPKDSHSVYTTFLTGNIYSYSQANLCEISTI